MIHLTAKVTLTTVLENDRHMAAIFRENISEAFLAARNELIGALRDCGFSEKEIFEGLDSSEYGRKADR